MGRDFRKILAWRQADDLVVAVYDITKRRFPPEERYALTAQLRSAAVSIAANIAEGAGRGTLADFRQFLFQAQGSLTEVEYLKHISTRLGYLNDDERTDLETRRKTTGRLLTNLIRWAGRALAQGSTT